MNKHENKSSEGFRELHTCHQPTSPLQGSHTSQPQLSTHTIGSKCGNRNAKLEHYFQFVISDHTEEINIKSFLLILMIKLFLKCHPWYGSKQRFLMCLNLNLVLSINLFVQILITFECKMHNSKSHREMIQPVMSNI